jgi:hypothetical protein
MVDESKSDREAVELMVDELESETDTEEMIVDVIGPASILAGIEEENADELLGRV